MQCSVQSREVCLHNSSLCDGHPMCDVMLPGGEAKDEQGCTVEDLKMRMKVKSEAASYKCQSFHYNPVEVTVHIIAVICDGYPECWRGIDELGCQTDRLAYYVIGRCI